MPARTRTREITASVRRDLAWSAETGAPPLGHLAGLHHRANVGGGYGLALDPDRPLMAGGAGVLEFAMLADLALGGAIRTQAGLALPMPTISMTLQLAPGRTRDVEWANAECTTRLERTATARAQLHSDDGEVIGDAFGVFALPKLPYDGPGRAMPWDVPPSVDESDARGSLQEVDDTVASSDPSFDALAQQILAHATSAPAYAWGTTHLAEQLSSSAGMELTPTQPMANRLGHVQGGALVTTAVLAASQVGRFAVETLVTATIEFIDAADLDGRLIPDVAILRAGGRSLFASVTLVQDGRVRCHVTTVFRR